MLSRKEIKCLEKGTTQCITPSLKEINFFFHSFSDVFIFKLSSGEINDLHVISAESFFVTYLFVKVTSWFLDLTMIKSDTMNLLISNLPVTRQ